MDLTHKLVFLADDIGYVHIVSGRAKIFELLAGEDVNSDEMNLGVAVLAGLRGAHLHNLARATLNDHETVFAESRALHGIGS